MVTITLLAGSFAASIEYFFRNKQLWNFYSLIAIIVIFNFIMPLNFLFKSLTN